jgi:hypothetical protein
MISDAVAGVIQMNRVARAQTGDEHAVCQHNDVIRSS